MCGSFAVRGGADVAEHGAGDHLHPGVQLVQVDLVGAFTERLHVRRDGFRRRRLRRCRRGRRLGVLVAGGASRPAAAPSARPETAAPSETGERGCTPAVAGPLGAGSRRAALDLGADLRVDARLDHRVDVLEVAEARVGVGVAVGVAERHVAAQRRRDADLLDFAVLGGDHRRPGRRVDRGADQRLALALARPDGREAVGEAGGRVDREARLGQARDRPEQFGGRAAHQLRAQHHGAHVGLRVVVGEDGAADVRVAAGRVQVARRGEDRVGGVVGIAVAVAVGVDAVRRPGRGQELHPALGAGARNRQVAAVVGLDLVDRREHLPRDSVGGARRPGRSAAGTAGSRSFR